MVQRLLASGTLGLEDEDADTIEVGVRFWAFGRG